MRSSQGKENKGLPWRRNELLKKNMVIANRQHASFVLGVLLCLVGSLLMFEGSVLGERTTGIAAVIGIVGIGLIAQWRRA